MATIQQLIRRYDKITRSLAWQASFLLVLTFALLALGVWAAIEAQKLARTDIEDSRLVQWQTVKADLERQISSGQMRLNDIEAKRNALKPAHFLDITFDNNSDVAIAVGTAGAIWISRKDRDMWERRHSGTEFDIRGVTFNENGKVALAVSENGIVLRSTDSGHTWSSKVLGTRKTFNDIAFGRGRFRDTAIAVGNGGIVFVSQDGGRSWTRSEIDIPDRVNTVAFAGSTSTVIVVGNNGILAVSQNRGHTWRRHRSVLNLKSNINAIATHGSDMIAAVGDDGIILVSTNRGQTWTVHDNDDRRQNLTAVAIGPESGSIIAVGSGGAIWTSTIGSGYWIRASSRVSDDLTAVSIYNHGQSAIAVGADGTVLVTTDSGITWGRVDNEVASELMSIALGKQHAIVVGDRSTILQIESIGGRAAYSVNIERILSSTSFKQELSKLDQNKREIKRQLDELINRKQLEETKMEFLIGQMQREDNNIDEEGSVSSWIVMFQINSLRLAILVIVIFLSQHMIGLARYNIRLLGFYRARRDAMSLIDPVALQFTNAEEFERIVYNLTPERLEFGHSSRNIVEMAMQLAKSEIGDRRSG